IRLGPIRPSTSSCSRTSSSSAEGGSAGLDSVTATARLFEGFPISADLPTGSKEARAEPFAAQCQAGKLSLGPGPWNADYVDELGLFPMGAYADQVDASSGAFNRLAQGSHALRIYGELVTSADMRWEDGDETYSSRDAPWWM